MTDLWKELQAEHDRIWDLLDVLTTDTGTLPDASNNAPLQRRTARDLVRLQSAHEFSEHEVIWPVVRRRCPGGERLAKEALEQEHKIRLSLQNLARIRPPTPHFTIAVHTLAGQNREHLSYEQNRVWPLLADNLDEREAADLGRAWRAARAQAPTRPHPHLPGNPRVTRVAGAALGPLERLWDRVAT